MDNTPTQENVFIRGAEDVVTAIFTPLFTQYIRETESLLTTLRRLNKDFLTLIDESDFVTVFAAVYDPMQHVLHPLLVSHVGLAHGRGLLIARTTLDEGIFHPPGKRITLMRYFSPRPSYAGVPQ